MSRSAAVEERSLLGVVLTRLEWHLFPVCESCVFSMWLLIKRNLIRKSVVCRQLEIV